MDVMDNVPIDRGWAWMAVLGAAVSSFFFVGGIRSLGILLVEVVTRFSASSAAASLIMTIVSIGVSVVAPLSTSLGERFSYRLVIMVGGALCALGCFFTAFATSATYFVLVYGTLTGIGFGCIAGPSLVVVGLYFNKHRSLANGLAVSGGSVGQLVIPLLIRHLLDEYGFSGGLMLYSAMSLHVICAALLMRPFSFYSSKKKKRSQYKDYYAVVETPLDGGENGNSLGILDENCRVIYTEKENNNCKCEEVDMTDFQHQGVNCVEEDDKSLIVEGSKEFITDDKKIMDPILEQIQARSNESECTHNSSYDARIPYTSQTQSQSTTNMEENEQNSCEITQDVVCETDPQLLTLLRDKSENDEVWMSLTDLRNGTTVKVCSDSDEELVTDSSPLALPSGREARLDPVPRVCKCGAVRSTLKQRVGKIERQQSTLSRISVKSLEVTPHQEVPDSPPPDSQGLRIQCPEDLLANLCCCCPPHGPTAARPLIPWYMFKDPLFVLYVAAICLGNSGYMNAGLFLPAHAEDVGMSRGGATWLLSIMGVVDLLGRVGGGWVADLGYVSRSRILAGCLLVTGVSTFVCVPLGSHAALVGLSVVMGLLGGCCVSLQTVVLVDFFGAEKLSATCGLSIMCQGLINIFVPSLLGILRDHTGSYTVSYFLCAAMMVLSAAIFSLEHCARARRSSV